MTDLYLPCTFFSTLPDPRQLYLLLAAAHLAKSQATTLEKHSDLHRRRH